MNFKNLLIVIILTAGQFMHSQNEIVLKDYNWEDAPKYSLKENSSEPIIALKDKTVTEFVFEDEEFVEYYLKHQILWLNSDEKIEAYNKVYLPYNNNSTLIQNKARVINIDGKTIELDKNKIHTAKDEETGRNYKYFAFEGVTKGSIIEYFYIVKRNPRYSGNRIIFQSNFNKESVEFDLFAPKNLVFEFKSENGIPEVQLDTLEQDRNHWELKIENLLGLQEEEVSAYNASKSALIYKLDRNTYSNTKDISSYNKVAQNIYSFYYTDISPKTQKSLNNFFKEITNNEELEGEALIKKIEFYIKNNIFIANGADKNLQVLDEILEKKVANETGIIKLYTALFKYLNVKHEIVITSDRQELKFDKSFEANNYLTDFLVYFDSFKTYLSPTDLNSRYGFPPAYLTDNYGLFIKEVKVGEFKSGLGKIKYIKPISANKTIDKMVLNIGFDKDNIANTQINLERSMSGYYGQYFHPKIHLFKEENKTKLIESFAQNLNEDVEIKDKKILNDDPELFGLKPITFVLDFESESFTEKAGKKYLFKVGELIGRQIELYQEKERVLPVENEFTRSYLRTLNIEIPNGYKIANLEDININNSYIEEGNEVLIFNSYYEINENKLVIIADEHYRKNIIDVDHYEDYRRVINSAADFNKVVLVFEPI